MMIVFLKGLLIGFSIAALFVLHKRLTTHSLKVINKISGIIILLFGIFAIKIFL